MNKSYEWKMNVITYSLIFFKYFQLFFTQKSERENSQKKDHKILQLSLPVEINNEVDRFLELYQWQINLTKAEDTTLNKINDRSMRTRTRLTMVCQHVINDLSTHPLVAELNKEIDSLLNVNLAKCSSAERRRYTCEALIMLKFDRNAKVHEVFVSGPKVKLVKLFPNDLWNEGVTAFFNAHKTGVDFKGIEPYEVIATENSAMT